MPLLSQIKLLTFNWIRGWKGLEQEDWRYVDLKKRTGKFYELVNFSGIHMFPTLIVFACCLPFKFIVENTLLFTRQRMEYFTSFRFIVFLDFISHFNSVSSSSF